MLKKIKYIIFILIIFTGFLHPYFSYSATDNSAEIKDLNDKINEHKQKIKELEETMAKYQKSIDEKKLQAISLKNQLSLLGERVNKIQTDVDLTKEKIEATELEIKSLEFSISDKSFIIERQKKMLGAMIKKIHADDQKNSVEIMLTNSTFGDFYSQLKNLEDVYSDLGRSVKNLRLAKEDLSLQKDKVDEQKKNYVILKNQLEQKQEDLKEQSNAKQSLLADTKASEAEYQTLLGSLKKQYQTIEAEVRSYEDQVRKKLEEQNKIKNTPAGDVGLGWPVASRYITAYFHDASYPFRNVFEHNAIDIRASYGTPVHAAASGYVGRARTCSTSSCYAYVLLIHTSNLSTVYGHLSKILVSQDQFVNKGDVIGYSGGTPGTVGAGPFVTGAHLHFETRLNGIPVDPLGYLTQ
jgi:murein DD-endopeptidase MepM/ murein hydrolase activator NlpD